MLSPLRAFRRHGGRRVGTSALTIGLVTSLASLTLIVSGPAPAGADHDPTEATAEIHITKIVNGAAPGAAGTFTTGDGPGDPIPGFPVDGEIADGETVSFEVPPGTYDVTETGVSDPSPHIFCSGPAVEEDPEVLWSVAGPVLTLTPTAGSVTACVFTNNIPFGNNGNGAPGEINVIKIVEDDPGLGEEFHFSLGTGKDPDPTVPSLAHGETTRLDATFVQLGPNNNMGYTLGEGNPGAWYPYVRLTCGGNYSSFTGAGITIYASNRGIGFLTPGINQFATCIFLNRFDPFPSVEIVKSGPATARVGDVVEYTFSITNTTPDGEDDGEVFEDPSIPDLVFDSITDPRLPSLTVPDACLQLDNGDSCEFTASYTVLDTDTDPLTNEVTVAYRPDGFPDVVATDSDDHSITILPSLADLTVTVVGGDPDFELTGPGVDETFTLDADGASVTFEDLGAGEYTLDLTALEAGLVLDAIDCDPEETSVDLAAGTVVFDMADGPVTCTYTLSAEDDDDYEDYPGDDDFDFDTPFDNDDDSDDDQAPAVVAGDDQTNTNGGPGSADPGLGAAGDPGAPAPAGDTAPQAVDQLPRTGGGLSQLGLKSGLLMILLGVAALLGARRRGMTQP